MEIEDNKGNIYIYYVKNKLILKEEEKGHFSSDHLSEKFFYF